ncbi:MAG: 30S ribosomal protein S9 [Nanohaloarchaea archaeon SW_7_46_7]|nr:MAG: 30S ribosomal protein S9 [Nanohaloarchaea archaeon SW_7_46_7]
MKSVRSHRESLILESSNSTLRGENGKRKTAKARVTVKEGDGTLRVNSRPLHVQREMVEERVKEPLVIAGEEVYEDLTIEVESHGGGIQGQAEAMRMAIARALVKHTGDDDLEREFRDYDRNMMVEDPRRTETRKPSQSSKGARHKQQKSYR